MLAFGAMLDEWMACLAVGSPVGMVMDAGEVALGI
jgi:hypothetical protein